MSAEPAQTNIQRTDKRNRGMRSSIRAKITFWAGLCLILVSAILIGYSVLTLRQTSIDNATKEAAAVADATAGSVRNGLDSPLFAARTLAYSLGATKDPSIPISLSRDEANAMLRDILIKNPAFLGTYTLWEPNTFDGLDAKYVRAGAHDDTGRFIPYWVRGDNGIIHTEALTQYEIPGVGDWYILPRSTKQEVTIAPIIRRIQDQDVVIASFIIPIVQNDTFYGIAGVDAPIGFVQQLVDDINLYDGTTNAVLFTDKGTLIAVRQRPELANQPANVIYADLDEIQSQLQAPFTRLSPDGEYLQIFSPISVGEGENIWILGLIIPLEKITAPATTAAIRQVAISTVLTILALIFLWYLARQIVRPLQVLSDAAIAVSRGDLTVTANIHSHDEVESLANTFNSMTSQLRTLFATLEQRVTERTTALSRKTSQLQAAAQVARQSAAIKDPAILVNDAVHLISDQFGFYHAGLFLLDEQNEYAFLQAASSEGGQKMLERGHRLRVGSQGIVGFAAAQKRSRIALDTGADAHYFDNPDLPLTHSEAALPLIVRDRVIGVLDIQSDKSNAFTQDDLDTFQALADQLALAIDNARLFEETNTAMRAMEQITTEHVRQTWTETLDRQELAYAYTPLGTSRFSVHPLVEEGAREPDSQALQASITLHDQKIGVIKIKRKEQNWHPREQAMLEEIATQVGLALENARLLEETQARAHRDQMVAAVSTRMRATLDLETILQTAARELQRGLNLKEAEVRLGLRNQEQTPANKK